MPNKISIDDVVYELQDKQARSDIQTIKEKVFPSEKYTVYYEFKNGDYVSDSSVFCTIVNNICYVKGKITCSSGASQLWTGYNMLKNLPKPILADVIYGFVIVDASSALFCQIDKSGNLSYLTRDKSIKGLTTHFSISYPIA